MSTIRIEPNLSFFRFSCKMCWQGFELSDAQPVLYEDGSLIGDICPDCFFDANKNQNIQIEVAEGITCINGEYFHSDFVPEGCPALEERPEFEFPF